MKKITVHLKERSYPIYVDGPLKNLGPVLRRSVKSSTLYVVTNTTVKGLYLKSLVRGLKSAGYNVIEAIIPDGETYKNIRTLEKLYIHASNNGIDRSSAVIALGGGVVGDISGMFAATYMRGIPYIQVPTTLLAMVDASVGGKTGIDLPTGKNLVGAFYQPKFVWIDLSVLKTLPSRQVKNGIAEVIKYGIISDKKLFVLLENLLPQWHKISEEQWSDIVSRCLKIKAGIVERDEFERKGLRESLNFGHTFAHALETCTGYKKYLHGEAVALGMKQASYLGLIMDLISLQEYERIMRLIDAVGYPKFQSIAPKKVLSVMKKDKKTLRGSLRLVLPTAVGSVRIVENVSEHKLKEVLI